MLLMNLFQVVAREGFATRGGWQKQHFFVRRSEFQVGYDVI
jgi:hypothetical protein